MRTMHDHLSRPARMDPDATATRSWTFWPAVAGAWTLLGVVNAAQYLVDGMLNGDRTTWGYALVRSVPWWALWGIFTPLIAHLVARHPLDRSPRGRAITVHAAAAVLVAVAHILLYVAITRLLRSPALVLPPFASAFRGYLGKTLLDVFTYSAIAAGFVALSWHRRARDAQLIASRLGARASALEAQLSQSQLEALRAQLHPHFLFNTLNAISVLALKGDGSAAARTIARLAELLRLTMEHAGGHELTLAEELGLLERYVDIERTRFGDRLDVRVDVAGDCRAACVPAFCLQPLVENAVRHGVSRRPEGGRIDVCAWRDGASLFLRVGDDGPGITASSDASERTGVGLANTRARLERLYGGAARVDVESPAGGGAVVTLIIPFREDDDAPSPAGDAPAREPAVHAG